MNESDSGGEGGLEQFLGFPGQLMSYPPGLDAFREFCKAKGAIGGKWGKCIEFAGRQFRGCTVAEGEEYFYLLADLEAKKRERGIDESISLEYFDGDVQNNILEGFSYYQSQLEYGLSLPLTNLAKGVINAIGACPVQMNGNMWEVITVYDHLNDRWEREKKVRRITPEDVLQFYGGNCPQREDETLLDLRFRSAKQSVKSTVERKESLLDDVVEEETELELVLGELGLSRKKRVESRSKKFNSIEPYDEQDSPQVSEEIDKKTLPTSGTTISGEVAQGKRMRVEPLGGSGEKAAEWQSALVDDLKEVEERARLAILQGKEDTSQMIARLVKGIWLSVEEQESGLKKAKSELEKNLARAKTNALKKLGRHLMLKGYSQEEVDVIKADTYTEEEEEEAEVLGAVDGLDGVSPQMVLDNQGDDAELPECGSEKVVKEMSLRINDLESGISKERETSTDLLSAQAELQAKLDGSCACEDHALMCNQEFAEQFNRMKEAKENLED
ncbi:hypothetical protein GIB67_010665 [Kingdonia uniflora]|uniref:Uncharacterized protein n=1 Tax=Kingdonia uniflora TaxID=39325 RepID=A0A7J7LT43_9MAGN|nr:hypothetical protein GIB67_010665 [Kingdonia uniflora]